MRGKIDRSFWERFDEQLQEATRAALGYFSEYEEPKPPPRHTRAGQLAMLSLDTVWPVIFDIGSRAGWKPVGWHRSATGRTTILVVNAPCGCRSHFALNDEDYVAAATSPRTVVDYLWSALEHGPETACECGVPELPVRP